MLCVISLCLGNQLVAISTGHRAMAEPVNAAMERSAAMALPCLGAVARGVRSSEAPPSVVLGDRGNFVTSTPFALPQRSIVRELKHVGALLAMPEGLSVGESRPVSLLPLAGHEDNNGDAQTPAARAPLAPQNQYTTGAKTSVATLISIPGTTSSAKDEESVAATSEYPSPSATPPRAQSPMRRPPEAPEQESTSNNTASVAVRTSLHEKLLAADSQTEVGGTANVPPGSSDAPSSVSLQGAAFGPHASTVLPRPVHKVDKATAGATASQGSSTVIVPRQLEVSVEHAFGAVKAGGQVRPSSVTLPTAFRNAQRAQSLDEQAADGQARYLPPDRPTLVSYARLRRKAGDPSLVRPFGPGYAPDASSEDG